MGKTVSSAVDAIQMRVSLLSSSRLVVRTV